MTAGLFFTALLGAVVSSVVPFVNAEILLLGLALASPEAAPLIGVSALTGLPPFYLVSIAAPALGVRFGTFLAMGLAGRLLRFAVLVALPQLVAIPLLARIPRPGGF